MKCHERVIQAIIELSIDTAGRSYRVKEICSMLKLSQTMVRRAIGEEFKLHGINRLRSYRLPTRGYSYGVSVQEACRLLKEADRKIERLQGKKQEIG